LTTARRKAACCLGLELSTAIVAVALTVSPRRHFGVDSLQPGASVPLWQLGLLGPRVCIGGLSLASQAGKVRVGGKGRTSIAGGLASSEQSDLRNKREPRLM
jgi:hypothetical protein